MDRLKKGLSKLPPLIFTIIVLMMILWLTLAPKPLGEKPPSLFPGADKVAHSIMFGGFALVMLLDWQRKHGWREVKWYRMILAALISSALGILIEFMQNAMGLGRGFEYEDIIADISGAFIFAISYFYFQSCLTSGTDN